MSTPQKSARTSPQAALHALTVTIDIDPLVEAVGRHVQLTPQATQSIRAEFAQLFGNPLISGTAREAAVSTASREADAVLSTQAAADLVGVSRPYLVARIEAGDIPLHQQVGKQRRVLKSAVLAWSRRQQTRRQKALARLGADLDSEIFAD